LSERCAQIRRFVLQYPLPPLQDLQCVLPHFAASALACCFFNVTGNVLMHVVCYYFWMSASCEWRRIEWWEFASQFWGDTFETCVICMEEVKKTPWHFVQLPCCKGTICWSCLRRHAEGVIDDARPEMLCPLLPCKAILPDTLVMLGFRREWWSQLSMDLLGCRSRRKQRTYEQWVRMSGLAASCSARNEDVVHCPSTDCGHMWVLPRELRYRKIEAEPQSQWNPKGWALARSIGLYSPPLEGARDTRCLHCLKCKRQHCLLCGRPWSWQAISHEHKSCIEYGRYFSERHGEDNQWGGAKPCPSCTIRIIRISGCNHMKCTRCGAEWCWECLSTWSPVHYSCRSRHEDGCSLQ